MRNSGELTPDLLHAISRQHVPSSTYMQVSISGVRISSPRSTPVAVLFCCTLPGAYRNRRTLRYFPPLAARTPGNSGPNSHIDLTLLPMSECIARRYN
jgi:hypothetical protein